MILILMTWRNGDFYLIDAKAENAVCWRDLYESRKRLNA